MIFYGEKNLAVISRKTKHTMAKFSKDGVFETEDPELIGRMRPHFKNDGIDYKSLSYYKLRKLADEKKINTNKLKRADLVEALERSEL